MTWQTPTDEPVETKCELPLVPARVLPIASRVHANSPYALLANQNSTSRICQSERLSFRHAHAAKCEFYSHSRASHLNIIKKALLP